jgi:hypothetical protein
VADGYEALPAAPPDTPEFLKALPTHLEYPKLVYPLGEGDPVLVKDAEEEAAARAALGYLALRAKSAPDETTSREGGGDEPGEAATVPKKRGRKPKA